VGRAFYLVDAFAAAPFAGNPAGVVTRADDLTSEQMQRIARELGQTETCFVSTDSDPAIDFHLRWFTPKLEVDLCGHATIATYICLTREGRIPLGEPLVALRQRTRSGVLGVWIRSPADGQAPVVLMSAGVAPIRAAADDPEQIARVVGLPAAAIDPTLPLAADDSSARIIIPVRRLDDLLQMQPNGSEMVRYQAEGGYSRFTLFCLQAIDPSALIHVRHFAPANGIPEDPVTGTAHAALAAYLDWLGRLPNSGQASFRGEQGHAIGRPGSVEVELIRDAGRLVDVRIGGSGFVIAEGQLDVAPAG
jgi:PhzF family phenazine biosynthesis protein